MSHLLPLPTTSVPCRITEKVQSPYPEIHQKRTDKSLVLHKQWGNKDSIQNVEKQRLQELEKMLGEAQSRTAIVEQEAYDKAYAAGEKAGLALGQKRAEQYLQSMENVLKHAELELEKLQQASVHVVVDLAESISEKVMMEKPQGLLDVLKTSVKKALLQLGIQKQQSLKLVVNPHDLLMFQRIDYLPHDLLLVADDAIAQGTCKLLSSQHDMLIDPKHMIHKAAKHVKYHFLKMYEAQ